MAIRDDSVLVKRRGHRSHRKWKPIVIGATITGCILVLIGIGWITVHLIQSRKGDLRLIGTWKSDAEATITELKKNRSLTPEQEKAFRRVLGKMKVTYTATTMTAELDGVVETQPYQIVSRDADSVVIKSWSKVLNKDALERVRFVGPDTYWVEPEIIKMSECFRRINPSN